MSEPAGYSCPGCGQRSELVLVGGEQAFCGNDNCHVFSWNPNKTVEELASNANFVEWPDIDSTRGPRD